jgi:hypothetical protein
MAVVPSSLVAGSRPPTAWAYLLGGAIVGTAVTGLVVAHHVSNCDDCMMMAPYAAAAVALGTVSGVALGGVVYLVRRAVWSPPEH